MRSRTIGAFGVVVVVKLGFRTFISPSAFTARTFQKAGSSKQMATASRAFRMTDEEKFFFDLNGFIHIRGALDADEVKALNEAVDAHAGDVKERRDPALKNAKAGTLLGGTGDKGRGDLGGMLGWPKPHCEPFRALLDHPRILPYLLDLCGPGYRMDHLPLLITQEKGSEGFKLHGGPLTEEGDFNPTLQYRCVRGQFFNSLLAMSVQITDHNDGDGGFCVVRGSHKMNFPVPAAFLDGEIAKEHLYQPVTRAGDVLFFSEATVHGAMPWTADRQRRVVIYRFAPATLAYGRSYSPQWPQEMLDGLTPNQRAVLEPPYAVRLDRPVVVPGEEEPSVTRRAAKKRAFDEEVFGTKYF